VWNRRVLAEADHVLILADATGSPAVHPHERSLLGPRDARHARRTLVLSHSPTTTLPSRTAQWLSDRDVQAHLHVRRGRNDDVARVARTVAGLGVSVVLGSGGARGFAHIGALRAIEEAAIPVDHIAGASVGAVAAALYAMGQSSEAMRDAARVAVARGPLGDFTLPSTSLLRGARMEALVKELFGDARIEDLWLPFFCNACDVSRFEEVLYDRGPLVSAVLASAALPGVLPPRVHNDRILVDGGTSDALPGVRMRARFPGTLIAVDVSLERPVDYPAARYPTSLRALWERVRPGGLRTPLLPELFLRAASFSVPGRVDVVAADADLFLRPPVEHFGTSEVRAASELERIGYEYSRERLRGFVPVHARRDGAQRQEQVSALGARAS
jgi:predicted acylesterase/phospholipase RssA